MRIEELDAGVGDAEGGGGEAAIVLEVEEVVAELGLGEAVGGVWKWSASWRRARR